MSRAELPANLAESMHASAPTSRRFGELDSLRGVAALTVVLQHFSLILPRSIQSLIAHSPLRILVAGHQAVVLFFLLSGFVLTLPYKRRSDLRYGAYLLKRVCRIYLPYLAALMFAVGVDLSLPAYRTQNEWINYTWTAPVTLRLVTQHILFLGIYSWTQFNTAFWSLVYEMRISLVFPLIAVAVLRLKVWWSITGAILLSVAAYLLLLTMPSALGMRPMDSNNLFGTLHYASFFILGALLARNLDQVDAWFKRLRPISVGLVIVAAILFYSCSSPTRSMGVLSQQNTNLYDFGSGLGALLVIVLAMNHGPFHRFLSTRVITYLGTISYSLYLVHGTVLFSLIHACQDRVPKLLMFVLYLVLTFIVTGLFHRFVEQPTMLLGRRLTRRDS